MKYQLDTKLPNKWNLWYHKNKNDWTITGFEKLYEIKTIEDFWNLSNCWNINGSIISEQYYLMKDNIKPIWEDEENIKGGRWSFKIKEDIAQELWDDLSSYLVSGNLSKNYDGINGISITRKKNGWIVIKIWNKDIKDSSLKNINYEILQKWGVNVIYIAHMPN